MFNIYFDIVKIKSDPVPHKPLVANVIVTLSPPVPAFLTPILSSLLLKEINSVDDWPNKAHWVEAVALFTTKNIVNGFGWSNQKQL